MKTVRIVGLTSFFGLIGTIHHANTQVCVTFDQAECDRYNRNSQARAEYGKCYGIIAPDSKYFFDWNEVELGEYIVPQVCTNTLLTKT